MLETGEVVYVHPGYQAVDMMEGVPLALREARHASDLDGAALTKDAESAARSR